MWIAIAFSVDTDHELPTTPLCVDTSDCVVWAQVYARLSNMVNKAVTSFDIVDADENVMRDQQAFIGHVSNPKLYFMIHREPHLVLLHLPADAARLLRSASTSTTVEFCDDTFTISGPGGETISTTTLQRRRSITDIQHFRRSDQDDVLTCQAPPTTVELACSVDHPPSKTNTKKKDDVWNRFCSEKSGVTSPTWNISVLFDRAMPKDKRPVSESIMDIIEEAVSGALCKDAIASKCSTLREKIDHARRVDIQLESALRVRKPIFCRIETITRALHEYVGFLCHKIEHMKREAQTARENAERKEAAAAALVAAKQQEALELRRNQQEKKKNRESYLLDKIETCKNRLMVARYRKELAKLQALKK